MIIKIDNKDVELKYTYNSFRYMEDLNVADIGNLETNPFKVIKINEILLLGALNHNPKEVFGFDVVSEYLEARMDDGTLFDVSEKLMGLLEKSSFFQNLQGEQKKEEEQTKEKKVKK